MIIELNLLVWHLIKLPDEGFTPVPDGWPLAPLPGKTSGETGSPVEFATLFPACGGLPCACP